MNNYNKILGGLLGGALGDALGSATQNKTIPMIKEIYDGYLTKLMDIVETNPNFPKGSVTDDFSLTYHTAVAIVNNRGEISEKAAADSLESWHKTIFPMLADAKTGTNGPAKKMSAVGLFSKGDNEKAVKDAITIASYTHKSAPALAGAAAVSAAVSEALKSTASTESVINAALKAALEGDTAGETIVSASVYKRMILAVNIAKANMNNTSKLIKELADLVGTGNMASESVAVAFGIIAGFDGDFSKSLCAAVNIGGCSDTIATIVGSILGALNAYYDEDELRVLEDVNGFNIKTLARVIDEQK